MFRHLMLTFLLLGFVSGLTQATVIDVPSDQPTIQDGVDFASPGDTVLVAPGTYFEHVMVDGKNIVLTSLFSTTGDSSYIATTIIDGSHMTRGVSIIGGVDTTMVLAGFTIQNGHLDGGGIAVAQANPSIVHNIIQHNVGSSYGGGIFITQASPIIESNAIISNSTAPGGAGEGGGILCFGNSQPRISGNVIRDNTAPKGGGIGCVASSSPTIIGNIIVDNDAEYGGGIYCHTSSPSIENNLIEADSAWANGGGIFLNQSDSDVRGNTFKGNYAFIYGGGIYAVGNSVIDLGGNGIYGNGVFFYGGAIYCEECDLSIIGNTVHGNYANWADAIALYSCASIIRNSIISGHEYGVAVGISAPVTSEVSYCDFYDNAGGHIDGSPAGFGVLMATNANGDSCDTYANIFMDPLYCDPGDDDYSLDQASPAVGAGQGGTNIGAFGIGCGYSHVPNDEAWRPFRATLSQNYPNPFNPATTIEYSLSTSRHVTLDVFNILGQRVRTLTDAEQSAGSHAVVWDGRNATGQSVATGAYLYRLRTGEYVKTSTMLLLR